MTYEPYVIKTRQNDLNKINQKNKQKQDARSFKGHNPTGFDPLG